ncbi:MAG: bifunctional serine/threonine-protein kinase/formylglycine-generating enzyme family protein [Rivularia sp. (in: cyanobacteria)]
MQLWTPNQQLQNGKFTIQKVLGGGGYGVTYSAIDKNTNNIVAIKTLNPIHQSKADFEQQQVKFVQEAFRLVQCSHPHIVKVHEVINEKGLWGMVMEYISGEDLAVYINQRGKLSEVEALKYINQVGTALEYIHQQGMLHRDVKPNNIVLRQNQQEAVLIDFGLAREFNLNQTGSMTNVMTEGYAPIEQYERRGKFGAYTDVYALAATLYTLLTGEAPLPSRFRITGIPLPSPKQRNPDISDRVNDGIIKGMELEPKDRIQTVREWLELVIPSQVKPPDIIEPSKLPTTIVSPKPAPEKPVNNPRVAQTPRHNSPVKIQTRKFEFEYATLSASKGFLGFGKSCEITRYRGQAEGFTEDLGNGVILEMVKIPGGSFIMGAPKDEEKSRDRERPQHKVNIQPFFMGKYQVNQEQYERITGKNPSHFQGKKRPVETVNWYDAVEFCTKLSKLTGKEYRLPSEAEWEYACRAGTTTPFHFGETITTDLANYNGNRHLRYTLYVRRPSPLPPSLRGKGGFKASPRNGERFEEGSFSFPEMSNRYRYGAAPKGVFRQKTTDVGSFPGNPFGLYDMHGNISEWCLDDWHDNYEGAPSDSSAWFNDNNNLSQKTGTGCLRGGCWDFSPDLCRSASRGCYVATERYYNFDFIGFRVACGVGRDS